jgi:TonB family protein
MGFSASPEYFMSPLARQTNDKAGSAGAQDRLFLGLPQGRKPWSQFAFSTVAQALGVLLLVWVQVLHPEIMEKPEHTFRSVMLVPTPVPVNHAPQPIVHALPKLTVAANVDPAPEALRLPAPTPKPKVIKEETTAPQVRVAPKKLDPLPAANPVIPRTIKTNVFSTGSSATPTIATRAPEKVQTGGFGDPNGIPAKDTGGKPINIAQLGSFDLPAGPGYGNGTGGARGARGVVASAGFGNGVAIGDPNARSRGSVRQAGFGDADVPAPPTIHSHAEPVASRIIPAEILSKPVPIYTDEARRLHIEGEVLLEVVLQASGNLRVVRVVRGLGHGLDDAAVRAAEQIHFKPELRDGQPADSTAVLHVIFQMA